MKRCCIMKSRKNRLLPIFKPCVLKLWEGLGDRAFSWTRYGKQNLLVCKSTKFSATVNLKDPKMIGNRGAAIIAIARRGGDRMMGDVYSWQILCKSLFASPIANFRTLRAAI